MENSKKEEPVYTYIEKQPKIDSSKLNSHSSRSLESKETEIVSVTSSPDNENSLTEGFTEIVISDSKEDKSTNKTLLNLKCLPSLHSPQFEEEI